MDVDINLEGFEQALDKFKALPEELQLELEAEAMPEVNEMFAAEVATQIPVVTGKRSGKAKASVKTKVIKKTDGRVIGRVTAGGPGDAFWLSFVEFGFFHGSRRLGDAARRFIPANPFFRRSFDTKKDQLAAHLYAALVNAIKRRFV